MDNKQIAHDLAVSKLCGSCLPADKLVEQYRQYYEEIYDYLKTLEKPKATRTMNSPF